MRLAALLPSAPERPYLVLHEGRAVLGVPLALIYGAETVWPAAVVEATARAFPRAALRRIAGAGHFPFLEAPEAFSRALRQVIAAAG
jgi:proline iminopeptidase